MSFVPERWQPQQWSGDAAKVLDQLALRIGGTWSWWEGKLCLSESPVPNYLRSPTALHELMQGFAYKPSHPWKQFLLTLTDDQIASFEQGQSIPLKRLNQGQIDLLHQIAAQDRTLAEMLPHYIERGELVCYITGGVGVFWRGKWVESDQLTTDKPPFVSPSKLLLPPFQEIREQTAPLLKGVGTVNVKAERIFTLAQLPSLFKSLSQSREFIVGAQVKGKQVVVSAGNWEPTILMTLIQGATRTEIRRVERLFFLAPSSLVRHILGDESSLAETKVEWQRFLPIVSRLCSSPLSKFGPLSAETLLKPTLIPYPRLTSAEKEWVNREGYPSPPPPNLHDREDVECYFFPSIRFEFNTNEKGKRTSRGFSPLINYGWVALRTAVRLSTGGR
ncbi:MAG: hypothetical protein RMK49_04630 [Abditibacteriales bacterium]|nr:hypothetical protein [Abditibacteriales bacterium]